MIILASDPQIFNARNFDDNDKISGTKTNPLLNPRVPYGAPVYLDR